MTAPRRVAAAVVLITFALTASAQDPEAQAVSASKQASKEALKALKAGNKSALATLDADLDAIEPQLTGATTPAEAIALVADAVVSLQDSLAVGMDEAITAMDTAAASALEQLSGGGDLLGIYPEPLYDGTRGVLDKHREAVFKALGKARASALKRLAKTSAHAEDVALGVTFTLNLPALPPIVAVNEGTVALSHLAELDAAIGVSRLTSSDDGVIFATGRNVLGTDVDVTLFRARGAEDTGTAAGGNRWTITLDGSTGLQEGGYAIVVAQATDNASSVARIGLR